MGPFAQSGSFNFYIFAGAAKCDIIKKGKLAGMGTVSFGIAFVSQVHIYIGTEKLVGGPDNYQTAPGQYPLVVDDVNSSSNLTFSYDLTGISGDVYVVFHMATNICM
jgi:hypothetical protein